MAGRELGARMPGLSPALGWGHMLMGEWLSLLQDRQRPLLTAGSLPSGPPLGLSLFSAGSKGDPGVLTGPLPTPYLCGPWGDR